MSPKIPSGTAARKQRAAVQRTSKAKRPPAVRDNVLGRRPSRSDPFGEQPGTVEHNQDQLGAAAPGPKPPSVLKKSKKR